jgi:hypothetical protein
MPEKTCSLCGVEEKVAFYATFGPGGPRSKAYPVCVGCAEERVKAAEPTWTTCVKEGEHYLCDDLGDPYFGVEAGGLA